MITLRKVLRAARAATPAWLILVFAACALIPGPLDEVTVLLALVVLCSVQPVRARRAVSAWRGGKSHRSGEVGTW